MDDFAKTSASSANHKIAVKGQPKVPFGCMPLQFNQNKHKILCSELKQLYTAITRARVNVWIFDQDQENRAPMFNFFEKLDLIDTLELGKSTEYSVGGRRVFTAESTAADWEKQGFYFYKKEFWTVAYKCFKKAPNKEMLNRCDAHMHAKKAYEMAMELRNGGSGSLNTVNKKYVDAAKLFLTCGMGEEAAICLKNGKEWKQAGELFAKFGKVFSQLDLISLAFKSCSISICKRSKIYVRHSDPNFDSLAVPGSWKIFCQSCKYTQKCQR